MSLKVVLPPSVQFGVSKYYGLLVPPMFSKDKYAWHKVVNMCILEIHA